MGIAPCTFIMSRAHGVSQSLCHALWSERHLISKLNVALNGGIHYSFRKVPDNLTSYFLEAVVHEALKMSALIS